MYHEVLKLLLLNPSLPRLLLLLHLLPVLVLLCRCSRFRAANKTASTLVITACITWCEFVHLVSLALPP
jgi:hypothetical protein